jgi:hypothetical protein
MFKTKLVQKIKTHMLCSITFSLNSCRLWDYGGKIRYSQTGHRWHYNMAHELCMLDNEGRDPHSQYVIFIPFPLQQWLQERAWMWCYKYTACLAALYRSWIQGFSPENYTHKLTQLLPQLATTRVKTAVFRGRGGGKQYGRHIRRMLSHTNSVFKYQFFTKQKKQTARSQFKNIYAHNIHIYLSTKTTHLRTNCKTVTSKLRSITHVIKKEK